MSKNYRDRDWLHEKHVEPVSDGLEEIGEEVAW